MEPPNPLTPFTPPTDVRVFTPEDPDNPMRAFVLPEQSLPYTILFGDAEDGGTAWCGSFSDLLDHLAKQVDQLLVHAAPARDSSVADDRIRHAHLRAMHAELRSSQVANQFDDAADEIDRLTAALARARQAAFRAVTAGSGNSHRARVWAAVRDAFDAVDGQHAEPGTAMYVEALRKIAISFPAKPEDVAGTPA